MSKVTILGSGAAPGVPSLTCGWGDCNPDNPKNRRMRTGTFIELNDTKLLIDTSPDIRQQLLDNNIRALDAVLYSHAHADHLHGIDDLREITRIRLNEAFRAHGKVAYSHGQYNFDDMEKVGFQSIECYALKETVKTIRRSFPYLVASRFNRGNPFFKPSIKLNEIKPNKPFFIKNTKVTPLKLLGHNVPSCGYAFNDGEVVHLADFKTLAASVYKQIPSRPKLLILPLTTPFGQPSHAGFDEVMEVIAKINPERAVINHMATECDYDKINQRTPDFVSPAYDGMVIEL